MRYPEGIEAWSRKEFGGAALGDSRRLRRVQALASAMASTPGASIPRLCETSYDVKAAYNLFRHPKATPENLQAGHRSLVRLEMETPGATLLLEDTTELNWEASRPIPGLGPVGNGSERRQGFLLHSVLAVRWAGQQEASQRRPPLEVLGLADQQYYIRKPIPVGEDGNDSKRRKARERESQLWELAGERVGLPPDGCRWIRICDRGADLYEFLQGCQQLGHGFVIRAAQDRALVDGGRLFEQVRALPALGGFVLERRQRPGQPARRVQLLTAAMPVNLKSPQRPGASCGKLPPLPCHVVRVWEPHPPEGEEGLEWILLVDRPIVSHEQALEAALQYATRWVIEDFHKALKTGVGAERLQLEDAHRLFAAISIMSVVALRLVDLRERLRIHPQAAAEEAGLNPLELRVLAAYLRRTLHTVQDVALAIGRLGGHMNRKADGLPGMLTLWHGMIKLQALVAGARLGLQFNDLGND